MDREVKSILAPRGVTTSSCDLTLAELGNCLCLSDTMNLLIYGGGKSMESLNIGLKIAFGRTLFNQISICDRFIPISTWKYEEILMQQKSWYTHFVSYNLKEKKFTKVKIYLEFAVTSYIPIFTHSRMSLGKLTSLIHKNKIV